MVAGSGMVGVAVMDVRKVVSMGVVVLVGVVSCRAEGAMVEDAAVIALRSLTMSRSRAISNR